MTAEYGYRDGSSTHRVVQRLEEKAKDDQTLACCLKTLVEEVSSVKSAPPLAWARLLPPGEPVNLHVVL
jgi:hypothetical protein